MAVCKHLTPRIKMMESNINAPSRIISSHRLSFMFQIQFDLLSGGIDGVLTNSTLL